MRAVLTQLHAEKSRCQKRDIKSSELNQDSPGQDISATAKTSTINVTFNPGRSKIDKSLSEEEEDDIDTRDKQFSQGLHKKKSYFIAPDLSSDSSTDSSENLN